MALLDHQSFYLVGIKGVAMTALAQCLLDAGKKVTGSDVSEDFVTQPLLQSLSIVVHPFSDPIPTDCDCVIYTAAHQGIDQSQVQAAIDRRLTVLSHAEALADLFNQKQGIAVCGVGGKSTTSAMISEILQKAAQSGLLATAPAFAIGVGDIISLHKTGQWSESSQYFVAEADEYAANPSGVARGEEIIPRFSYLHPFVTVCTNLQFDHPDVYRDFAHTRETYLTFFQQIKLNGHLIINGDDPALVELAAEFARQRADVTISSFGLDSTATCQLLSYQAEAGTTISDILNQTRHYQLTLHVPGQFNVFNALGAALASSVIGLSLVETLSILAGFQSTKRRVEYIGEIHQAQLYDDYAHHPLEIKQVIHAFREWYPQAELIVAFQAHTFSRTKALFDQFVTAFAEANQVLMIDIFASAREKFDPDITSTTLCQAIEAQFPHIKTQNLHTLEALALYLRPQLKSGTVCLTVGAGDIYKLHELLLDI